MGELVGAFIKQLIRQMEDLSSMKINVDKFDPSKGLNKLKSIIDQKQTQISQLNEEKQKQKIQDEEKYKYEIGKLKELFKSRETSLTKT